MMSESVCLHRDLMLFTQARDSHANGLARAQEDRMGLDTQPHARGCPG